MSSFIGHSLAAATIYLATEFIYQPLPSTNRLKVLVGKKNRLV